MKIKSLTITIFSFFLLFSTVAVFLPQTDTVAAKNTLYVNNEGAQYTRIQDAINNASDGDMIFVHSGIYYETIVIDKTITLNGEDKNTTVIDANGKENAVDISADYVAITGFTITNSSSDTGAAVILKSEYINVSSCIITNNSRHGIYMSPSSGNNTIYNNIITNNVGKGVTASSSTGNTISENIIINNECGICPCASTNNIITGNHVENNVYGIFMCSTANNNIIYHNSIINNTGQQSFDINNNQWYNPILKQGNYWSDHPGIDYDGDDIGDIPYSVYGGGSRDIYPLMKPYTTTLYQKDNSSSQEICILVFYSLGCESCKESLAYIEGLKADYPLNIQKHDILVDEELELQQLYFEAYNISKENRDIFSVFISDKYFYTEEEITTELEQEIKKHLSTGCNCPNLPEDEDTVDNLVIFDMSTIIIVIFFIVLIICIVFYSLRTFKKV